MEKIREDLKIFNQTPKEHPHMLFKYYNFPTHIFKVSENRDYSKYSVIVKNRGGRNYFIPFGWQRFGLHVKFPDQVFNSSTCVAFYTADVEMIKRIIISGKFPIDENFRGNAENQNVFVTPYIDHLDYSGTPTDVPRDLGLNLSGNSRFRIALQCRVPRDAITEIPDPSPYYSQNIRENSVWRVPASSTYPYSICIKQVS